MSYVLPSLPSALTRISEQLDNFVAGVNVRALVPKALWPLMFKDNKEFHTTIAYVRYVVGASFTSGVSD